jgi:hypothetical protein
MAGMPCLVVQWADKPQRDDRGALTVCWSTAAPLENKGGYVDPERE